MDPTAEGRGSKAQPFLRVKPGLRVAIDCRTGVYFSVQPIYESVHDKRTSGAHRDDSASSTARARDLTAPGPAGVPAPHRVRAAAARAQGCAASGSARADERS